MPIYSPFCNRKYYHIHFDHLQLCNFNAFPQNSKTYSKLILIKETLSFSHLYYSILTYTNLTLSYFNLIIYLYKEIREVIKELPIKKKIQLSLTKTTFELSQNLLIK